MSVNTKDSKEMEKIATAILYKMASEGKSLQEASGISNVLLEEIYSLAYSYYNQGKYKESLSLFQFLTGISPQNYKFVLGLGASFQELKDYPSAAANFFEALNINPLNPLPAFYIAECLIQEQNPEGAKDFLTLAIEISGDNPRFASFKERCDLIRKSLNNKK